MKNISAVIPAHNASAFIAEVIVSLQNNINKPVEIIVVDDDCADDTAQKAVEAGAVVIANDHPSGPAGARNAGAARAVGNWILFVDSDVLAPDGIIDEMVKLIDQDPTASGVSTMTSVTPIRPSLIGEFHARYEQNWSDEATGQGGRFPVLTTRFGLIRKTDMEKIGGFQTHLKTASIEDYHFYQKAESMGLYFLMLPAPEVGHDWEESLGEYFSNLVKKSIPFFIHKFHKPKFDSTHTTPARGFGFLMGALGFFTALPALFFPALLPVSMAFLALFTWLNLKILAEFQQDRGALFAVFSWLVLCVQSAVLLCCLGIAALMFIAHRLSLPEIFAYARAVFRKSTPAYAIVFVTSACNGRCDFCFYRPNWVKNTGADLPLEKWTKVADGFSGRLFHVNITGGEPMLAENIAKLCERFVTRAGARVISINTNGSMPDRIFETAKFLCNAYPMLYVRINLSIDAVGSTHDELRGIPGLYDNIKRAHDLLLTLRNAHPRLSINAKTTVNTSNFNTIESLHKTLLSDFSFDSHDVGFVRGEPSDPKLKPESSQKRGQLLRALFEQPPEKHFGPRGIFMKGLSERVHKMMTTNNAARGATCLAGEKFVAIDADGTVYACESAVAALPDVFPKGAVLGRLSDFDFNIRRLLASEQAASVIAKLKRSGCRCGHECALYVQSAFSWKGILDAFYYGLKK